MKGATSYRMLRGMHLSSFVRRFNALFVVEVHFLISWVGKQVVAQLTRSCQREGCQPSLRSTVASAGKGKASKSARGRFDR